MSECGVGWLLGPQVQDGSRLKIRDPADVLSGLGTGGRRPENRVVLCFASPGAPGGRTSTTTLNILEQGPALSGGSFVFAA